jgi:hypothetical protein
MPPGDKVTSGDLIEPRSGLWNDMVDAANTHKRQRLGLARLPRPPKITPPDRVKVKNVSGESLAAGSVVQLGTFLLSDVTNDSLWFEADKPSSLTATHAILRKALPNDEIGEAQIIGTVVARVNVNDENDQYAKVVVDETELDSTDEAGPIRILFAPGTGSQTCAVLIDRQGAADPPKSRLIARIADTETELERYTYDSDSAPYDLLGRPRHSASGYGKDEGEEEDRPALPTCAGEVYEMQDVGSGVYKYVSLGACTLINPTPWKYYAENHDSDSGEPTDEDLLLVNKHGSGSIYVVERPLSWTPHAVFRATTISGGFVEWDVINGSSASHYAYTNNQMWGEIAEPDDSSFTGGIKILAPGVRVYEVIVYMNVWLSGITASTVTITSALPAGYNPHTPYSKTISTGNYTTHRVGIELHGLFHYKRGDKTLYTTLSLSPSVTPTLDAMMYIRPWTL